MLVFIGDVLRVMHCLRALQLLLIPWIKNQCSYSHCTDKETKAQRSLRPGSCWIELDLILFNCRAGFNQVRMPSRLKSLTAMLSCRSLTILFQPALAARGVEPAKSLKSIFFTVVPGFIELTNGYQGHLQNCLWE